MEPTPFIYLNYLITERGSVLLTAGRGGKSIASMEACTPGRLFAVKILGGGVLTLEFFELVLSLLR
jgi:hypothetical protein